VPPASEKNEDAFDVTRTHGLAQIGGAGPSFRRPQPVDPILPRADDHAGAARQPRPPVNAKRGTIGRGAP